MQTDLSVSAVEEGLGLRTAAPLHEKCSLFSTRVPRSSPDTAWAAARLWEGAVDSVPILYSLSGVSCWVAGLGGPPPLLKGHFPPNCCFPEVELKLA